MLCDYCWRFLAGRRSGEHYRYTRIIPIIYEQEFFFFGCLLYPINLNTMLFNNHFVRIPGSFSLIGTTFGVIGSLSLSLYSIYTKKTLPYVNQEVLLLNYYVNLYSCVLFVPLMMIAGEFSSIATYPLLFEPSFWGFLTIGGLCGFAIGYVTGLQIQMTSPLTHNISGTAKACAQTVLATQWFNESKSYLWWLSNVVVLFGSGMYARVKQLEIEKNHKERAMSQSI